MKRLTWRDKNGAAHPCPWTLSPPLDETMKYYICERLAAYEDTGLKPEEVADFVDRWETVVGIAGFIKENDVANHLRELVQAEQDKRVTLLPEGRIGDFEPFVTDARISKILTQEEAEAEPERGERKDDVAD